MTVLAERTALHIPTLHFFEHDGITYAVDGDAPNWIAVEQRAFAASSRPPAASRASALLLIDEVRVTTTSSRVFHSPSGPADRTSN